ncbi:MAG TPA: hypothetical protein VGI39_26290 [Polyangiaceae bacterium]
MGALDEVIYRRTPTGIELPPARGTMTFASSVLEATLRQNGMELEARLPFLVFDVDDGHGGTPLIAGNVELGGYYAMDTHGTHVRVGAIFTLPTAATVQGGSSYGQPSYLDQAALSRGWDRAWLWTPHQITPFAPSFRLSSPPGALIQHATEVVLAPMIAVNPGSSTFPLSLQASQELGVHPSVLRLGLRVELAGVLGVPNEFSANSSVVQFSVLPFAGIDAGPFFFDAGLLVNTADPVGLGGSWSMRFRAGGRF